MKQFLGESKINGANDTGGWLTGQEKSDVLRAFLPSDAMRRYLAGAPLTKRQISELVCGAPVPLTDKLRWMEYLAAKENLFPDIPSESLSMREQSAADPAARQTVEASFSYQAEQIKLSAVKEAEEFKKLAAAEAERSAGEIKAKYEKNLKNAVDAAVKVIFS